MYPQFSFAFIGGMGSISEMVVVVFVIFLLFGSKSLPGTLRTLGKWMEQLRQISREVQREILEVEEPFRHAQQEWEKEVKDLTVGSPTRRHKPVEKAVEEAETVAESPPPIGNDGENAPLPRETSHEG